MIVFPLLKNKVAGKSRNPNKTVLNIWRLRISKLKKSENNNRIMNFRFTKNSNICT